MEDKSVMFNNLCFGNLILAKRKKDNQEIEKGHRTGPFLVLGRRNNYLICLYATSKNNKNSLIRITKNNYNLNKDTYITSNIKLISVDEFLKPLYCLNEKEMKNLIKVLYINKMETYAFSSEPKLELGDIIELKQQHLIIGETNDSYITIKVEFDNLVNSYRLFYNNKNLLPKNLKYKRIAFISDEEINKCLIESKKNNTFKKYDEFDKKIPELVPSPLRVGNLIIYKKLLYYLYYELGNKKLSFSVSRNQTPSSQKITINGTLYYANFSSKRDFIENQENVFLVDTATEEEKAIIKKKRRKL